mgnify:CR=1 FL=1
MNIDLQTENVVKTKLEQRGNEYKIKAPVTGSVVLNNAVVASFGDGSLRFFGLNQEPFEVKAHKGVILTMSSNGQFVYTGGDDGKFLKVSLTGDIQEIKDFVKELRGLSQEELAKKENELKKELFELRFQAAAGQLEQTARLNEVKKQIARIKTVQSETK